MITSCRPASICSSTQTYRPPGSEVRMTTTEMQDLQRTMAQLRQCVEALRRAEGKAGAVGRLANDLYRLEIDARDVAEHPPAEVHDLAGERIQVPDAPYDDALFRGPDCDDEGLGGLHGKP